MPDNVTAHILSVLAAKKAASSTVIDPRRVAIGIPDSRVPKGNSIVSFKYLLANAIKYQPDEANSEHVTLRSLATKKFKNGAKGVVTSTLTDLPQYPKLHKWEQVIRCTPANYTGRICDCPGIVYNCACPRFVYTWNWVGWSKHASVLNATNDPPDITNPRRLIGTCKHLLIVLQKIKQRGL